MLLTSRYITTNVQKRASQRTTVDNPHQQQKKFKFFLTNSWPTTVAKIFA